jgi:hypothetical protein
VMKLAYSGGGGGERALGGVRGETRELFLEGEGHMGELGLSVF